MWETTGDWFFYRRKRYYGLIMDTYFSWKQWFEVKNIFMMDLSLLSSQDVNWWAGVVWITCGLLWWFRFFSAVWTLILTAPIHCRGSIHSIQQMFIFGWTIPLVILKSSLWGWATDDSKFWGYYSFKTRLSLKRMAFFVAANGCECERH